MYRKILLMLVPLFSLMAGCVKEDPVYHGKIVNAAGQKVHLDLYNSLSDYSSNQNPVWSADIPDGQFATAPASLEGGKNYYLDWYSEDYLYTNWPGQPILNMANITPDMDPLRTLFASPSYMRTIILDRNNVATHWKAYDAGYNSSNSVWQTLTDNEKYRELVFRKDLSGTYSFKDDFGVVRNLQFTFSSNGGSLNSLSIFLNFQDGGSGILGFPYSGGASIALDTMFSQSFFPQMNYEYYFSRQ